MTDVNRAELAIEYKLFHNEHGVKVGRLPVTWGKGWIAFGKLKRERDCRIDESAMMKCARVTMEDYRADRRYAVSYNYDAGIEVTVWEK